MSLYLIGCDVLGASAGAGLSAGIMPRNVVQRRPAAPMTQTGAPGLTTTPALQTDRSRELSAKSKAAGQRAIAAGQRAIAAGKRAQAKGLRRIGPSAVKAGEKAIAAGNKAISIKGDVIGITEEERAASDALLNEHAAIANEESANLGVEVKELLDQLGTLPASKEGVTALIKSGTALLARLDADFGYFGPEAREAMKTLSANTATWKQAAQTVLANTTTTTDTTSDTGTSDPGLDPFGDEETSEENPFSEEETSEENPFSDLDADPGHQQGYSLPLKPKPRTKAARGKLAPVRRRAGNTYESDSHMKWWLGGLALALGGAIALWTKRKR